MGVKKYKPDASLRLLEGKVLKARDSADRAILSAKKTVRSAKITIKRTHELIEQSREIIDAIRKSRSGSQKRS